MSSGNRCISSFMLSKTSTKGQVADFAAQLAERLHDGDALTRRRCIEPRMAKEV